MIEGYRCWILQGEKLRSTNQNYIWEQTAVAYCSHGCNAAECLEHHKCTCGLYSLKSLKAVVDMFGVFRGGMVYGAVLNHGVVHVGEEGYRAEQATIKSFFTADFELAKILMRNYPDVEILMPPPELVVKPTTYEDAWERKQKALQAKREAELKHMNELQAKYPGGYEGEKTRLQELLRGKTRPEIQAFAKEYGESKEYAERMWLQKPGGSTKFKPGDMVFESNNTELPFVYVGSYRPPSDGMSMRILLGRNGLVYRRAVVQRWDEDYSLTAARRRAIEEWE